MESYGLWNLQGSFWAGNALCSGTTGDRFTYINAGGNNLDSTSFSNATSTQPCRPPYRNQPEYVAMKSSESVSVLPNRTSSGNVEVLPALRSELLGEHSNQESGNSNTMSLSINAQSSNTLSSEVSTNLSIKKGKQRTARKKSGHDKSETALPVQYFNQQYNPMYSMMFGRSPMKRPESTSDESEDEEDENENDNTNDVDNYSNDTSAAGSSSPQRSGASRSGYECGQCDLVADTRPALKKHIALCHPNHEAESHMAHSLGGKMSGSCPMPACGYLSLTRDELESHVARHVAEGFQRHAAGGGKKCAATAAATASLQRVRYEREEYRCQICSYTCTIEKAFYKHLKLHSVGLNVATVKISCVICGKDRPSEVEMNKHMRKHRDNRYFCCDVCIFRTVQLKKLIQHRRMHTGEKPHLCPHCAYRSARRDNLRSHVRRVHKKENLYCDTFSPRGLLMAGANQPGSPGSQ